MFELLSRAVLPILSLKNALADWAGIAHRLAEPPRKRVRQTHKLLDILS